MDTKECKEFLEYIKTAHYTAKDIKINYWDKIDEVIKRLEIWEDLKNFGDKVGLYGVDAPINIDGNLKRLMEEWEQTYFPKEEHPAPLEELKIAKAQIDEAIRKILL